MNLPRYKRLERYTPLKRSPIAKVSKRVKRERATKEAVRIMPDGREICQENLAGKEEYRRRLSIMWARQHAVCRWCGKLMFDPNSPEGRGWELSPSFDHDRPRGAGGAWRDDRIWIFIDGKLAEQNAAVHMKCNTERGSQRELTRASALAARKVFA